jgi:hypothetical protein
MAIDYVIDYGCVPKQAFGSAEIIDRLKGRNRANTIIRLFRESGDPRTPDKMGFEFVRNTPEGEEETQIVVVQDLLDRALELDTYAHHCAGCPANALGMPFGCIGFIQYPLSEVGERWLMERLPGIDQPLLWLLLRQGIQEMGYDGADVAPLRASGTYFEANSAIVRDMTDFQIDSNQVFEMTFLLGKIQPSHAGMLLHFFDAVPRATEASQIVPIMKRELSADEIATRYPLLITPERGDDATITDLKRFMMALHRAWMHDATLSLDV